MRWFESDLAVAARIGDQRGIGVAANSLGELFEGLRVRLQDRDVTDPSAAPPSPTRLVLIRHGESRSTVDRVVGGHRSCNGLTDKGVRQAKALRDRLARTRELA